MKVEYFREPLYKVGTLLENKKLGIFRITSAEKNVYLFRTIVWYDENTRKNRNRPYSGTFSELEAVKTFSVYPGNLGDLNNLIIKNSIEERKLAQSGKA